MRKKINKAGNGLMLMMLTCNAVVPSASLVYAEAVQPMNIQLSLNSLAPKIYAGESAVYQMDFKVSGAMEEVNEQLNTAKKREIVIQLPEDTTFYSMPSDEAYLKTLAIASLDKDGQKVEIVPTYDADNHQLIYAFSSLRAGTSARLFLKLDTKNGVTPNNTEMALSAKFAAGEEELASTEAKTKIKAQLPIAATKSFDGVLDEDGKIKEGVIAAKSGDNVQWSVRVEVPTTEVGMSLIKDGEPVIVEDILNDNLSYVSAQGEDMTVNPNGQTVSFSFPTKTRDEQLKLLAEGKSLFVREFTLITKVKEGITEYTEIPNMVTATVTAKEDTQKTTESNKPAVVVSSEGRDSSQVNGSILYPIFYGPKDGNGGYNFDWNHLDANPTVIDTAQLSFYNQYHPMPGTNEPNQNDSDEHITDKNGDDFDWKNNVLTILEKGYQEINMNYTLDEKLTFDSVQINKPVLEYCNDPAEVYPNDYEMNIIVELDNGTKKTIKVNFDELAEDRRPTYQTVYYNREKLGLSENEKVSKYTISLKPLNGQMIDGRTSVLVQPRYGIVPGSKGQATATVSYDVVLYDGQKITRTEGGRGSAATIGSRHVTIVQEEKSKPTIISDVNFTEKDGSLVKVGDNRVNFMVKNLAASASVVKGPVIGNILLPKGVHIKKDDAKEEYYFYNRSGQILKQEAKYTVVDNYNNTGRQLVQVQWDRDRVNPTEVLTFEFGVEVTKDASYHLDLVGYVLAESEQITVPTDEGFQHIAVEKDKEDMDKDTITDEDRVKLKRTYVLMSKKDLQTIKLVKGDLDTDYSYLGKASLGGEIDYRITMTNTTKENITKLGFIDILPSVDDKTVLDNVARGSKFTPTLTGAITVPEKWADKVEIFYSTETNPSRETVLTKVDYPTEVEEITNPTDAADPAWQTAAQVGEDWSSIHSFKIELKPGTVMIPGQDITLNFKMQAPTELSNELLDVNTEGKERAAWNSFAMTTNGLLPIEPQRVGVYVEASSSVTAEYYIEGTNTKLPLPDGATEKVVTDDLIGKAYSDQAVPKRLTDADGKTYVLVEVEGEPTLKDGSAATTGTVAKEEQVIKYQYKEVKGNVIVHYVNEKGEKIKVDVTDTPTTSTGTPYDTTDNKPTTITTEEGKTYKLVPDKTKGEEAGKVVEGTTEVTYVYEEVKGDVIVHYEDEEGNVIKPQVEDTAETSTGTPYDTTDNKPETITTEDGKTYELVPEKTTGNEQGKVVEGTTEVTYVYKLVVGSVTAEYYIEGTDTKLPGENGETIKVVKPEGTPTGEAYSDQAPTKLTDADGKTYVLVEVEGEPTLKDGSAATTGTVAKEEQVIKYQYKEVKGDVIVHYVDEKGDTIKVDVTDTELTSTGTDYDTTDNKPTTITTEDGKTYELVPDKTTGNETGKVVEGTTEVTYVYKEVKGDVVVHYVDEEGNTIKVDVTDTELSSTGTDYDTTNNKPTTITTDDGKTYELVPDKTTGNETGKVVEGTTEVTYVYKEVKEPLVSQDKPKGYLPKMSAQSLLSYFVAASIFVTSGLVALFKGKK
ncbi:MucBP domain-containing protein [Granulicatella balaenopterae]|uniref:MucBP domain-containing protein n=1 Tax=Granulicatella balaenopterae TaxID=137733 RepID=A0A1H9N082_9LACT|nr:MucBP domain-containing protein [Granulicatella balaenopterae]SER29065.1 MucBP domain-containing protein [Granulicatella balaenopterae]